MVSGVTVGDEIARTDPPAFAFETRGDSDGRNGIKKDRGPIKYYNDDVSSCRLVRQLKRNYSVPSSSSSRASDLFFPFPSHPRTRGPFRHFVLSLSLADGRETPTTLLLVAPSVHPSAAHNITASLFRGTGNVRRRF